MTPLAIELPARDPFRLGRWLAVPLTALPLPFTAIPLPQGTLLVAASALWAIAAARRARAALCWQRLTLHAGGRAVLVTRDGGHEREAQLARLVLIFNALAIVALRLEAPRATAQVLYLPASSLSADAFRRLRILRLDNS